jgi:hypothetical protein
MRRMVTYGRAQAAEAIYRDYLHPETPRFDDKTFQRIFRVTKTIFQRILELCANNDEFFTERMDAIGSVPIDPAVKVLYCLKILAFGVPLLHFKITSKLD